MKRYRGDVLVVLPTDDVMREYEPSELLLHQIDLTLEALGEAVLDHWIQGERHWGDPRHQAELSCYDLIFTALYPDLIGEEEVRCKLSLEDRRAVERLIKLFTAEFYVAVAPILEGFKLSDHQLANIECGWMGPSLVVRIPKT